MITKKNFGSTFFDFINVIIMLGFMIICLYPFYYMLIYSFSTPSDAIRGLTLLPRNFTLENYIRVAQIGSIPNAALISVLRTILGGAVTLFCCSFFAYLMTKTQMYLRKFFYRFVITTMYVSGGLIPTYLVIRSYGLRNTFLIYILPYALSAYYVILIKTFIEQIPSSMEEAAILDGAGIFTCFVRVIMPLSLPVLATITVFAMVNQWSEWFDALIYISRKELFPLQYILYNYLQEAQARTNDLISKMDLETFELTPESVRMTITAIVTIPIMLVYPFMQRYFIKGIMFGAVKG